MGLFLCMNDRPRLRSKPISTSLHTNPSEPHLSFGNSSFYYLQLKSDPPAIDCILRGVLGRLFAFWLAAEISRIPGKLLSGARGGDAEAFFGNMIIRQRDKAHGVQRITSRAWLSDPYMKNLINQLVLDKGAICQRIRFSAVFRNRFQKYVAELTNNQNNRIKDLASAKHRFSSHSQPMARTVLYFVPLLRVAQSVLDERGKSSPEGRDSYGWLSSMTDEAALQLAMMADCADESMGLCRFFDKDNYDKSAIVEEIGGFMKRVTWLFGDQRGALKTGYTQHMITTLSSRRTIFLDGVARFLGGKGCPSAAIVDKCFRRMENWLQLCRHTVRAEVPEFETLQSFECFSLKGNVTDHTYKSLNNLARVLHLGSVALRSEFEDLRPIAKRYADGGLCTNMAWHAALEDVLKSAKSRAAHPTENVVAALIRFIAWNASTTNVERRFGKAHCTTSMSRGDVSERRLDDEAVVLMQSPDDARICDEARLRWTRTNGAPREPSVGYRMDKGSLRKANPHSEASFLKRRRLEVGAYAAASVADGAACAVPAARTVGELGWEDCESWPGRWQHNLSVRSLSGLALLMMLFGFQSTFTRRPVCWFRSKVVARLRKHVHSVRARQNLPFLLKPLFRPEPRARPNQPFVAGFGLLTSTMPLAPRAQLSRTHTSTRKISKSPRGECGSLKLMKKAQSPRRA